MPERPVAPTVAIVDYGLGNLFSIRQACARVGLAPIVTADRREIAAAAGVILPGVGAFGDAMAMLHRLDLVSLLHDLAASDTPLLGICLGLQLLMAESQEFGRHAGLGILEGSVTRLERGAPPTVKVPAVGWNQIHPAQASWDGSDLEGLEPGAWMYFVHSYRVVPADPSLVLSHTTHGPVTYCSSLRRGALFACQFHPERSGAAGLQLYRHFARRVASQQQEEPDDLVHGHGRR
jgi:glutamine amidotransferase